MADQLQPNNNNNNLMQNLPQNLPPDDTTPGITSSSAYLFSQWIPGQVMRTLHMRIVDVENPRTVTLKHPVRPGDDMVVNVILGNAQLDLLQVTAWGRRNIERLTQDLNIGEYYKFLNMRVKEGGDINYGTVPYKVRNSAIIIQHPVAIEHPLVAVQPAASSGQLAIEYVPDASNNETPGKAKTVATSSSSGIPQQYEITMAPEVEIVDERSNSSRASSSKDGTRKRKANNNNGNKYPPKTPVKKKAGESSTSIKNNAAAVEPEGGNRAKRRRIRLDVNSPGALDSSSGSDVDDPNVNRQIRAAALISRQRSALQFEQERQWAGAWRRDFNHRINMLSSAVPSRYPDLPGPMPESELYDMVSFCTNTDSAECYICWGEIEYDDAIISLACNRAGSSRGPDHSFHFECLKEWVTTQTASCPTCRAAVDRVQISGGLTRRESQA